MLKVIIKRNDGQHFTALRTESAKRANILRQDIMLHILKGEYRNTSGVVIEQYGLI